jgi:Bax protein
MKLLVNLVLAGLFIFMLMSPWLNQKTTEKKPGSADQSFAEYHANMHDNLLPDFSAIADVKTRKKAFFDLLRPAAVAQNNQILASREIIDHALSDLELGYKLSSEKRGLVVNILKDYRLATEINEANLKTSLMHIDTLPIAMVLTQAANESGWGTSRFAREGLNFFGLWCFKKGCGIVPNRRNAGSNHEVAAFDSLEEGIAAYFKNMNTHMAYQELRQIRQNHRDEDQLVLAHKMIHGLMSYSERGQDYIDELDKMMITNQAYFVE